MFLTVAICTWNRCQLLGQTLEQMTHVLIPSGVQWELLIVNNNSTDDTDVVTAEFSSCLPLHPLYERRPGLSTARNLAVNEARGEYILWTDDDVLVDPNWIVAYVEAFQHWPKAVCFGGPVHPAFAAPPPHWLAREWAQVSSAYAIRDLGDQPIKFTDKDRLPYGANFVVRTAEQRRHRYDTRFGHRGEIRIGGEETHLLRTVLLSEREEGWWVPGAIVRHIIPPDRMTTRYIRRYYLGHGRYQERLQGVESNLSDTPSSSTHHVWALLFTALRKEAYYRISLAFCRPKRWVRHLKVASVAWGRFIERRECL